MKSKAFILMATAAVGIVLGLAASSPGLATPINSSMLSCQPVQAPQSDLTHSGSGVSTNILAVGPRLVTCSVTLGKLTPNATAAVFFITGSNSTLAAASTSCTLTSWHYTGRLLGSMSFTASEAHYVRGLLVPVEMVSLEAYTSLTCQLPQHATGTLESVVAWL